MKVYNIEVFQNTANTVSIFQSSTGFTDPKDNYTDDNLIVLHPEQVLAVCKELKGVAKQCLADAEAEERAKDEQ